MLLQNELAPSFRIDSDRSLGSGTRLFEISAVHSEIHLRAGNK